MFLPGFPRTIGFRRMNQIFVFKLVKRLVPVGPDVLKEVVRDSAFQLGASFAMLNVLATENICPKEERHECSKDSPVNYCRIYPCLASRQG